MRKLFSFVLIVLLLSTIAAPALAGVGSDIDPVQPVPTTDGGLVNRGFLSTVLRIFEPLPTTDGGLLGTILFSTANRSFEPVPTADGGLAETPAFIKIGIAIINAFVDLLDQSAIEDISIR